MSTSTVTEAGVGLAASPLPHVPGTGHEVREDTAYVHPQPRFDRAGWSGYHVHRHVLHVRDPAGMAWLPVGDLEDLPDGRWVRVTDAAGRLAVPFELRLHMDRLEGRWLGVDGGLLPAEVPPPAPAGREPALDPGRYAPAGTMERWLAYGGWQRLPVW